MSLKNKSVLVTGGSRGLGLGLVEVLCEHGADVTVVARDRRTLDALREKLGVATISADITDPGAANRILAERRQEVVVLNAGVTPRMERIDRIEWKDFTRAWETDVRGGLYWLQAALNVPLAPGARVLAVSSGAATNGSPLSGGYAGAKRMLWFMTRYANELSRQRGLGIRFQTAVPMQIVGGTGVGDEASAAYAQAAGVSRDAFLARFGTPISPRQFGEQIVSILQDPAKASGNAFGLKGDTGITVLESGEPA